MKKIFLSSILLLLTASAFSVIPPWSVYTDGSGNTTGTLKGTFIVPPGYDIMYATAAAALNANTLGHKTSSYFDNKITTLQNSATDYLGALINSPVTVVIASSWTVNKSLRADYVCDGLNDQVEINAAITSLAGRGGLVYLLEGTYNIGEDILLNQTGVTLQGTGLSTVVVSSTTDGSKRLFVRASNTAVKDIKYYGQFEVAGVNGFELSGCYFEFSSLFYAYFNGFTYGNNNDFRILNNSFYNGKDYLLWCRSTSYIDFINNKFSGPTNTGVNIYHCDWVKFSNNYVGSCVVYGMIGNTLNNVIYNNNLFNGNPIAIVSSFGSNVLITGNVVREQSNGFDVDRSFNAIISGNLLTRNTAASSGDNVGIRIRNGDSKHFNNKVIGNNLQGFVTGIKENYSDYTTISDNKFTNCTTAIQTLGVGSLVTNNDMFGGGAFLPSATSDVGAGNRLNDGSWFTPSIKNNDFYQYSGTSITAHADVYFSSAIHTQDGSVITSTAPFDYNSRIASLLLSGTTQGNMIDGLYTSSPTWQVKGALQSGDYLNDVRVSTAIYATTAGTATDTLARASTYYLYQQIQSTNTQLYIDLKSTAVALSNLTSIVNLLDNSTWYLQSQLHLTNNSTYYLQSQVNFLGNSTWYNYGQIQSTYTALNNALNGKRDWTLVSPSTGIGSGQIADDVKITTGNVAASGTPSATTYLRGDNSWATPAGGSSGGYWIDTATATLQMGNYGVNTSSDITGVKTIKYNDGTSQTTAGDMSLASTQTVTGGKYFTAPSTFTALNVTNLTATNINTGGKHWEIIYSTIVVTAVTTITIPVNGDADRDYEIKTRFITTAVDGSYYRMRFNTDTGNNYCYMGLRDTAGTLSGVNTGANDYIELGAALHNSDYTITTVKLWATGLNKDMFIDNAYSMRGITIDMVNKYTAIWDSAANLTQIVMYSSTANQITSGSTIEIWAKR